MTTLVLLLLVTAVALQLAGWLRLRRSRIILAQRRVQIAERRIRVMNGTPPMGVPVIQVRV